jgi:hypothetical protein
MNNICIVLTCEKSKFYDAVEGETQHDMQTIRKNMPGTEVVEIMIDATTTSHLAEEAIVNQLRTESLRDVSSCHIIINAHGNFVTKDIQDAAVKKIIERVSEHLIPITQLTLLVCYAMAQDNPEAARERLIHNRGLTAVFVENIATKDTASEVLMKKIRKMKLPMSQNFEVWGPTSAYDPFTEEDLVAATIHRTILEDKNGVPRNKFRRIHVDQLSMREYKASLLEAIEWLELHAVRPVDSPLKIDQIKQELKKEERKSFMGLYDKHVTRLGKVLDQLFSKIEEKYKFSEDRTTTDVDICHFLHQKLMDYATEKQFDIKNAEKLRAVFKLWKKDFRANSIERLSVYRNYLGFDDELYFSIPSRVSSPVPTPPLSPGQVVTEAGQGRDSSLTETSLFRTIDFGKDAKSKPKPEPEPEPKIK